MQQHRHAASIRGFVDLERERGAAGACRARHDLEARFALRPGAP
jgi:hypothetical protein